MSGSIRLGRHGRGRRKWEQVTQSHGSRLCDMDTNVVVGCVIIAGALALLTFLVLWSRRSIGRIARNGYGSARELRGEVRDDR